jgi:XTP/dITP diphosphohydrolase
MSRNVYDPTNMSPRLLIATTNRDKVREISQVLSGIPYAIATLDAWPHLSPPAETAQTFNENAQDKARYYAAATGELTVAEDSGLEIERLDGAPGVESARFGGPAASYADRFTLIYDALRAKDATDTAARFVCAVALVNGRHLLFQTTAVVEGRIAPEPRGSDGFGYDPIFFYPPYQRTLAELSPQEKASISHRGHAFRALRRFLEAGPTSRLNAKAAKDAKKDSIS